MKTATWTIRRTRNGYVALVKFDSGSGLASVGATGSNERAALAKAAVLADQIVNSPIFTAVAPPGTAAAIKAITSIAKAKDIRGALAKYSGRGAVRLARALRRFW